MQPRNTIIYLGQLKEFQRTMRNFTFTFGLFYLQFLKIFLLDFMSDLYARNIIKTPKREHFYLYLILFII